MVLAWMAVTVLVDKSLALIDRAARRIGASGDDDDDSRRSLVFHARSSVLRPADSHLSTDEYSKLKYSIDAILSQSLGLCEKAQMSSAVHQRHFTFSLLHYIYSQEISQVSFR